MLSKPKAKASSDRKIAREQVVGDLGFEAGRIVIVRVEDYADSSDGKAGDDRDETEVGRFRAGGCAYCVRVCESDPYTQAPADAYENIAIVLTERELQIAALLARGRCNKQIAGQLRISEHTVSSYLTRIFSKLGVHSRSAVAARFAAWMSRTAAPPT